VAVWCEMFLLVVILFSCHVWTMSCSILTELLKNNLHILQGDLLRVIIFYIIMNNCYQKNVIVIYTLR